MSGVRDWLSLGQRVIVATVVRAGGSSPRRPGSVMFISQAGGIEGSVSAGCMEGAVLCEAQDVFADGRPRIVTFGDAGDAEGTNGGSEADDEFDIGPSCGGSVTVLLELLDSAVWDIYESAHAAGRTVTRVVKLPVWPTLADADEQRASANSGLDAIESALFDASDVYVGTLDVHMARRAVAHFDHELHAQSATVHSTSDPAGIVSVDGVDYFVSRTIVEPRIVCVGATHIAQVLTRMACAMGYRVTIVDPRSAFARPERFPEARQVVTDWPQREFPQLGIDADTAVCALTHDEKIDVPALACALETPAFYIGCLGRPTTQLDRRCALLGQGFDEAALARVFGPIGVWTGGRRPEDIALSVLSQIAAVRNGTLEKLGFASSRRLSDMTEEYVHAYDVSKA